VKFSTKVSVKISMKNSCWQKFMKFYITTSTMSLFTTAAPHIIRKLCGTAHIFDKVL